MYPEMLKPSGGSVKSETFNYFFSGKYWIFWIFLLNFVGEFRKDSTLIIDIYNPGNGQMLNLKFKLFKTCQ